MVCDEIRAALGGRFDRCEETSSGSRIATHCLYPSFTPVSVFVAKIGDGYRVHDGAGAYESAWLHGRDDALIARVLRDECLRFRLDFEDNVIGADVNSNECLRPQFCLWRMHLRSQLTPLS
jgi:hypothetical protein